MTEIAYDPEDNVYLDTTDGLRVNPRTGAVHRASCSTQQEWLRPEVLPWPKYADDSDHPCGKCKPNMEEQP